MHLYGEAVGERPRREVRTQPPEFLKKVVDPLGKRLARAKNSRPLQAKERSPSPLPTTIGEKKAALCLVEENVSLETAAENKIFPSRAQFPFSLLRKIDEGLSLGPRQLDLFKQVARTSPGRVLGEELKRYLQQRAVLSPAEAQTFGKALGPGWMNFAAFHCLLEPAGETLTASSYGNIFGLPQFDPERVRRATTEARRRPLCEVAGVSQGLRRQRDTFPDVQPNPSSPMFVSEADRLQRGDAQRAIFQAKERRAERERLQNKLERLRELPHLHSTLTLA